LRVPVQFRHLLCVLVLCAPAYGSTPMPPTPTDDPEITCPPPVTAQSVDGVTLPVTYPPATVVGGMTPVATQCVPASPGDFPIGDVLAKDCRGQLQPLRRHANGVGRRPRHNRCTDQCA